MILVDDQIQVHNLFIDRFRLGPLTVQGANRQDNSHKQTTKNHWPTKRPKLGNSSQNGEIVTKRGTYLKAVRLQPTNRAIDQAIDQTRAQVKALPLSLELVKDLDQGLEVCNRPKVRSWP